MYTDGITRPPVLRTEYYICSPAYAVTDAIAPRGSSVVPRRAWLRRLVDLYSVQTVHSLRLTCCRGHSSFSLLACLVFFFLLHWIEWYHWALWTPFLYDIVKDKSLEYRSGRSPGEHLATLVAR